MRENAGLSRRLRSAVVGDVMVDVASRGRYATDASIYQMVPEAVVVPRSVEDVEATMSIAREQGIPVLPRGGGTSQCGQAVNQAIVLDNTRHLNRILDIDIENLTARVEPGLVLDELNRVLKPHGLWFPVDPSTASRCTLGGMAANNSSGGKSLRYGIMRDNVRAISGILPSGAKAHFSEALPDPGPCADLVTDMRALGQREADEIDARFPKVQRRVGGYNIDALTGNDVNMAHLPSKKVIGVCHFPTFIAQWMLHNTSSN